MANSSTHLDQIQSSQEGKEITANALYDAMSSASLFGRRAATAALTWQYFGGNLNIAGTITQVANGSVALMASKTQRVEGGWVSSTTKAISGATKAAGGGVLTVPSGHGFEVGDVGYIDNAVGGMTELRNLFVRITAITATTITVNVNTSAFSTYTSAGTIAKLTSAGAGSFKVAKSIDIGNVFVTPFPMYEVVTGASTITSYTDYRTTNFEPSGDYLSVSVAGSANVTLSVIQLRNRVIEMTGAITANISAILPAYAGIWTLKNATTGAFTLTAKTPAGTGVVLPQGGAVTVFSDGTNVLPLVYAAPSASQVAVTLGNTDGAISSLAVSASPTQAEVIAIRDAAEVLADDVRNLSTLLHAVRTALVSTGLMKGSA